MAVSLDVAIPTLGLSDLLPALIKECQSESLVERFTLYVNAEDEAVREHVLAVEPHSFVEWYPGTSLYHAWNRAAACAQVQSNYVAILNDDIELAPGILVALADCLDQHPEYGLFSVSAGEPYPHCTPTAPRAVSPQNGRRDFANWCFLARPEVWPVVDERFRVWYGDDDLIWKVHASGHQVGVLHGTGVRHATSTTLKQLPWVHEAIAEDQRLWASLGRS